MTNWEILFSEDGDPYFTGKKVNHAIKNIWQELPTTTDYQPCNRIVKIDGVYYRDDEIEFLFGSELEDG